MRDGGSEALAGFVRHDGRAPLQGPHLFAGVQHAAVGGFFLSGPQADAGEQTFRVGRIVAGGGEVQYANEGGLFA